jgi:hydrogenase-4 component E
MPCCCPAVALVLKGIAIPWLLLRAIREVRIRREVEPLIGFVPTLILGALVTTAAFIFADFLPLLAQHQPHGLFIPTALATLFAGFLLLMTRRKAITQVLGYLMLENGIFIFGILLSAAMPMMVEAGVLLDLLVAVFVMGIVMNQINREFSTLNTELLSALKE